MKCGLVKRYLTRSFFVFVFVHILISWTHRLFSCFPSELFISINQISIQHIVILRQNSTHRVNCKGIGKQPYVASPFFWLPALFLSPVVSILMSNLWGLYWRSRELKKIEERFCAEERCMHTRNNNMHRRHLDHRIKILNRIALLSTQHFIGKSTYTLFKVKCNYSLQNTLLQLTIISVGLTGKKIYHKKMSVLSLSIDK